MIFKIMSDFSENGLLKKLENFNILFSHNCLYVSNVRSERDIEFKKYIEDIFDKNSYIQEINDENINHEYGDEKEWCKQQISWYNLIKKEKEEQDMLKKTMEILEDIENDIEDEIKNKIREEEDENGS